jgi:GST-like protein
MIKFFYNAAPNPMKVALFLEESGLDYEPIPIDSKLGQQHSDTYKQINPNAKVPAIIDGDVPVFDSNAILLYLAEKTGQFLPPDEPGARGHSAFLADVHRLGRWPLLRPSGAFSQVRA